MPQLDSNVAPAKSLPRVTYGAGFQWCSEDGFARLTNEVQHHAKVLPWEHTIVNFPLKSGVNWPDFTPRGTRTGKIAAALDRAPSTIMREVKRNGSRKRGYEPVYADEQAWARRWVGGKLERDAALRKTVLGYLRQCWSPEQVAGHMAREVGGPVISHEPRVTYGAGFQWCSEDGFPLSRHSRLLIAARQPGKAAEPIASAMYDLLAAFPAGWRRTVTFDNGTEFARHYRLHDLGIQTFFCDTHSPWQKGGIENAIGRMRRVLPRKTDLAEMSAERFAQLIQAYNHTPRKCLDYQTPAEVFLKQTLHLKCESTFPLSRE